LRLNARRVAIGILALLFVLVLHSSCQAVVCASALSTPNAAEPDVAALMEAAQHQFGSGNYASAIATLQSVVLQNPLNGAAFYWLGRCYYEIRDFDRAVMQAEKSVSLEPKNSLYQEWLGRAYGSKADHDRSFFVARKVKKQFELAVQLDPTNLAARRDLADFCMQAPWIVGGNVEEARTQVDAIAAADPIEGHIVRAMYDLEALKKPDLAENEYREVLAAKPTKLEPYFEVAAFFQNQNKIPDMSATIEAAAQVKPNDPRIEFYRASVMVSNGSDLPRAEQYLKSYLASTPDRSDWPAHASAREWLGRLYEEQGKKGEAAEQYRAALQIDPSRKDAQARLAKLEKGSR
jgi:tetratricopeptide (TPR) repeat protein